MIIEVRLKCDWQECENESGPISCNQFVDSGLMFAYPAGWVSRMRYDSYGAMIENKAWRVHFCCIEHADKWQAAQPVYA